MRRKRGFAVSLVLRERERERGGRERARESERERERDSEREREREREREKVTGEARGNYMRAEYLVAIAPSRLISASDDHPTT